MNYEKHKPIKSKKLRDSAKGQQCFVRSPVCNNDKNTVVLAHLNGGGMALKQHDLFSSFACHKCHTWLDGGYAKDYERIYRDLYHLEAMKRTIEYWLENGFVEIK